MCAPVILRDLFHRKRERDDAPMNRADRAFVHKWRAGQVGVAAFDSWGFGDWLHRIGYGWLRPCALLVSSKYVPS